MLNVMYGEVSLKSCVTLSVVLSVVMCSGVLWWAVCRCVLCEEEDCVTVSLTPGSLVLVFLVTADTALHCYMLHYTAPC